MSHHKAEVERGREFKKLDNDLDIELLKQSKEFVHNVVVSSTHGKHMKVEPINSTFRNNIMIYCDEQLFGVLSPYHYHNIETMQIGSSYAGEDESLFEVDWEKYIAEAANFKKLSNLLCKAHHEYCLELIPIMPPQISFI